MSNFKEGFIRGWMECVGSQEENKVKLRQIAEAAFGDRPRNASESSTDSRRDDGDSRNAEF